jgi:hypothetical protein
MRAEGTEETTGLAVQQSVSQNRRLEAFIVRDQIRERPQAIQTDGAFHYRYRRIGLATAHASGFAVFCKALCLK